MGTVIILSIVVLIISITMSSVGKGGGNFYVVAMVMAGMSMHNAATSSQLIMFGTSITAMIVFSGNKKIDWKLTFIIGPTTYIMAFLGGYYAGDLEGTVLKIIFTVGLVIFSIFMFVRLKDKEVIATKKFGYWNRVFKEYRYTVNLWWALPITSIIGFFSGAVGISGGSFLIPLMVILFGIPIEIAIGTSMAMVSFTALTGFLGHAINGDFEPEYAVPLVIVAIIGGIIGSKFAIKTNPKKLKIIFAATNLLAALIMILHIIY